MTHDKYNELAPDDIIDTFQKQIERCIEEGSNYDHYTRNLVSVNRRIPPHIKAIIDKDDVVRFAVIRIEALIKNPEYNNAGSVSQVIVNACNALGRFDFTLFEDRLRKVKSRVFLIGRPMSLFPGFKSKVPKLPMEFPYAMWICMNGQEERDATVAKDGIEPVEMREILILTGLLTKDF